MLINFCDSSREIAEDTGIAKSTVSKYLNLAV